MELLFKVAGAVCVVGSLGLYARERSEKIDMRLTHLMQIYNILLQLKSELKYMSSTLPECFGQLSKHVNEPFDKWLFNLHAEMESERTGRFADIWLDKLGELKEESSLADGDIDLLAELMDKLGSADVDASVKAIDYVLLRLEENRELLKSEMYQKKRVIVSLSLFVGLITVILLF